MNKGFTLIELLVVVLIIGILSSVALPSYTKAVEKARLTEALVNSKAIMDAVQRHLEMIPEDIDKDLTVDMISDVTLKGGKWDGTKYTTKLFTYTLGKATETGTVVTIARTDGTYTINVNGDGKKEVSGTDSATLKNVKKFIEELNP